MAFCGASVPALALALSACGNATPDEAAAEPYTEPAYTDVVDETVGTELRLVERAREAGLDFTHETGAFGEKWMPETMGSGGGFFDWDGDGLPDVLLVQGMLWEGHEEGRSQPTSRLFRNEGGGRFRDVTEEAGLRTPRYGMGATFADYDADGDVDVYLTAVGDNALLRNDGGRLVDVTRATGAIGGGGEDGSEPAWSTAAAWVDTDRDGWLDLFVCNYVQWTPETDLFATLDGTNKSYATPQAYEGESCRLLRNVEGRRFEDVTEAAGLFDRRGKSLGIAVEDFDDDGWPDLVVANDTYPNFFYLNQGDGTFVDAAVTAGVAYDEAGRARAGMGVDVADLGGRGDLSIAIGNFSNEPLALFTEIGPRLFQDRAGAARLSRRSLLPLTFGLRFADLDLDGALDLLLANGHIEPEIADVQREIRFEQPPQLFLGVGDGTFVDASQAVGPSFQEPVVGRGIAVADVDRDGDLDVLMTVNGERVRLFSNELPADARRYVRVEARGRWPNPGAVGAILTLHAGPSAQRRAIHTSGSYLTQSEANPVLFGLGDLEPDSLVIRWPDGTRTVHRENLEAGAELVLLQEADGGRRP